MSIWVWDYKSSLAVYENYKIQVSTYARSLKPPADHAGVLLLDKVTGMPTPVEVDRIEERYKAFCALREYYRIIEEPYLTEKEMERFYFLNGNRIPTITTILGVLGAKALEQWKVNQAVEYIDNNRPQTDEQWTYHLKKAKTAHRQASQKAMTTGSIVHDAIHAYLLGVDDPDEIIGNDDKAGTAYLAFLEWSDSVKLKPIATELTVINEEFGFGGTIDLVAEMEDQ